MSFHHRVTPQPADPMFRVNRAESAPKSVKFRFCNLKLSLGYSAVSIIFFFTMPVVAEQWQVVGGIEKTKDYFT
jgi:hypothetical protein